MSGGRFQYADSNARLEIFGYYDDESLRKVPNVFGDREISELVWDVFNLIHDFDWYDSGDTSEGNWNKSVKQFKDKWFTEAGRKERIDRYINDNAEELRDVFGLNDDKFCFNCKKFTEGKDSEYGRCPKWKRCSTHRWTRACEDFDTKEE